MACILKKPTEKSKGVVIFTTPERDRIILKDKILESKIKDLKKNWLIGLHHNWHDFNFHYNPLFDFHMAGEEDLKETNGKEVPLIPMDACNFVPEFFKKSPNEKFWDILYVARAVKFKKIPEFFQCVRKLYDQGKKYRILFICPIPKYKRNERKTTFYNIREVYDEMFSEEEKDFFTLLTTNFRNSFPFDLETLAHFYKSSKIFVHFADRERRCRVASYAWASEIPIVAMECVGSLLPKNLRKEPYFYSVENYTQFDELIPKAIAETYLEKKSENEASKFFNLELSLERLDKELERLFKKNNLNYESKEIFGDNLGIRLGRHHNIGPNSTNSLEMPLSKLVDILKNKIQIIQEMDFKINDPEIALVKMFPTDKKSLCLKKIKIKKTFRRMGDNLKMLVKKKIKRLIGR